jgi:hypothetical protein
MLSLRYEPDSLVTVATFAYPWEAELARARLDAEGVESVIADEHLSRLYGAGIVGGVKVRVRREEADRASALLREQRPIPEIYLVKPEDTQGDDEPVEVEEMVDGEERIGDLVTVARFTTPWEAHLARTRLESEGIEACVLEERLPPVNLFTGEILAMNRLAVNESDAGRAREILDRPGLLEDLDESLAD